MITSKCKAVSMVHRPSQSKQVKAHDFQVLLQKAALASQVLEDTEYIFGVKDLIHRPPTW